MNRLARLSAAERKPIIDGLREGVSGGLGDPRPRDRLRTFRTPAGHRPRCRPTGTGRPAHGQAGTGPHGPGGMADGPGSIRVPAASACHATLVTTTSPDPKLGLPDELTCP